MSDIPPPPPPPPNYLIPTPQPGNGWRPRSVTAAGVIMIVVGVLALIVALVFLSIAGNNGRFGVRVIDPDIARFTGTLALIQAPLDLIAGILVLRLSSVGRVLGIVIAAIGLLGGISQLSSNGSAFLGLGLNGYVLFVLITQGHAFRRTASG